MNTIELRKEIRYYGNIPCDMSINGEVWYILITNVSLHGIGFIVGSRIFDEIEDRQSVQLNPRIDLRPCDLTIQYIHMKEITDAQMYYYGCQVITSSNAWMKYIEVLAKQFKANNRSQIYNIK